MAKWLFSPTQALWIKSRGVTDVIVPMETCCIQEQQYQMGERVYVETPTHLKAHRQCR